MLVLLLPLLFALGFLGFYWRIQELRLSMVYAAMPAALFLVFATEGLSAFRELTRASIAVCWLVYLVAVIRWALRRPPGKGFDYGFARRWRLLDAVERGLACFIGVIAGLVGLTAVLSAPNTWDAMMYHMPRVVEWISNRGVQLYPTIDLQQLAMPALSEYAILHLQLLLGSDRLANVVQWLAYVGSMVVVSLLARELGAERRVQLLAAVICGTIETGILGASGAKNDYVLAYWIAVAVLMLLRWGREQRLAMTLGLGSALALALFAKATAFLFLPPLVVVCFLMWKRPAQRLFVIRLPVVVLCCAAVCGPLWARNYALSGSISGPAYFYGTGPLEERMYRNGHITPPRSLANIIRNVGLHVAVPGQRWNDVTVKVLSAGIRLLGVAPNDPQQLSASQIGYVPPFKIEFRPFSETQSGNQVHFALLLVAGTMAAVFWRKFDRKILLLGAGILGGLAMFATALRWSPWSARYHLPLFVVGSVFTAIVLTRQLPRRTMEVVAFALLVLAIPLATMGSSRSLVFRHYSIATAPRERTYFFDNHVEFADSFLQAAADVDRKDCRSIGIDANQMHFEYPMMALVNRDGRVRRMSYVAVNNATLAYEDKAAARPCVVVCLACAHAETERRQFDAEFGNVEQFGDVLVFSNPNAVAAR